MAKHAETLRALATNHETPITVEVLPGLDHDLRPVSGRARAESADVEALALMARWAEAQVGSGVRSVVSRR